MEWNQPYPVMLLKEIQLPDFELVNFSVVAVEQVLPLPRPPILPLRCTRPAGGTS